MIRNTFYLFISFIFLAHGYAQAQTVYGAVRDTELDPVFNAHIQNLKNKEHTHSDETGRFELDNVGVGDSLRISFVGYKTQDILISDTNTLFEVILDIKSISLNEVVILPKLNALNILTKLNLQTNPVTSSQQILREVPGLFIGQHAGGGKAEQIFLRGFDVDHGTDVAITVDGLPVNMVSHAHGQGYADLHFLIPETIDNIDFGKGPYYSDTGNLNTAGYVNFNTKNRLDHSSIKAELGQFGHRRLVGLVDIGSTSKNLNSYIATEFINSDGPFDSPQNFSRINLMGKLDKSLSLNENVSLIVSHFTSRWDASGQIPQRAVDSGLIDRFGAIDDTEGGITSRTNVLVKHRKYFSNNSYITNSAYYSRYAFELYSNFTFFLEDPINGDQIRQKEKRDLYGVNSAYTHGFDMGSWDGELEAGILVRSDRVIDNELSRTANRVTTLENIQLGDVFETNYGTYVNGKFNFDRLTINPGLRFDYFDFQYNDKLVVPFSTQSQTKGIFSPKLNLLYNYSDNLQLYLKSGIGFHSNDTRVVLDRSAEEELPAAYGGDLGFIWKPRRDIIINTALWYLYSEQEFVYVGDAGIVEPSGSARREGIDFSISYQPFDWLYWHLNANYANPRFTDLEKDEDFVPLAPRETLVSGLQIRKETGVYGGLQVRYLADRPANEDNSIVAVGYTVVDMNIGYELDRFDFGIVIENLFDTEWNETQFATESRLFDEVSPVEEIHFTPGTPFYLRGSIEFKF
ncbi:TonB-dependent receptor [Saprospiraceae bacterium]|nr:TonB-dependent receptor [Saprospiraceae bacterium]